MSQTEPQKEIHMAQDQVAITLTVEQWTTICNSLQNDADAAHASYIWWRDCCDDKRYGAETAARYKHTVEKLESLRKIVEAALCPQPVAEKEE